MHSLKMSDVIIINQTGLDVFLQLYQKVKENSEEPNWDICKLSRLPAYM
jgi:hypothetical protein